MSDGCDEYAISLSVGAHEEVVTTAIVETNFLVERDGSGVSFPHPKPQIVAVERASLVMNTEHESLRHSFSLSLTVDVEAI